MRRLLTEVARRTLDCAPKIWGFGVGGALAGMARAGDVLEMADFVQWSIDLVQPGLVAAPDPTDHLVPVTALKTLAELRPGLPIDEPCERWARTVLDAPRLTPGAPRVHRPDFEPWSSTIWVDCMHTDGPGLATLGRLDEAVAYAREYADVLQRDDGLFHHGYDVLTGRGNGVAWGRGQAWALIGLIEVLFLAPDDGLARRLDRLVEAIARHEDAGRWHTVVDEPNSPVENSVAAYVADVVGDGIELGLVDPRYAPMVTRARAATLDALAAGGLIVSEATPVGDVPNYVRRATGVFPWGQAPVLNLLVKAVRESS